MEKRKMKTENLDVMLKRYGIKNVWQFLAWVIGWLVVLSSLFIKIGIFIAFWLIMAFLY